MAKTPENVKDFLTDLTVKLKVLGEEEKDKLLEFKEEESSKFGFAFNGKIAEEDVW